MSCAPADRRNIPQLRVAIESVISTMRTMGNPIPRSYLLMEDYLKEQSRVRELPIMTEYELLGIGNAVGLKSKKEVISCARYVF